MINQSQAGKGRQAGRRRSSSIRSIVLPDLGWLGLACCLSTASCNCILSALKSDISTSTQKRQSGIRFDLSSIHIRNCCPLNK